MTTQNKNKLLKIVKAIGYPTVIACLVGAIWQVSAAQTDYNNFKAQTIERENKIAEDEECEHNKINITIKTLIENNDRDHKKILEEVGEIKGYIKK
jgi:hypothetical protein